MKNYFKILMDTLEKRFTKKSIPDVTAPAQDFSKHEIEKDPVEERDENEDPVTISANRNPLEPYFKPFVDKSYSKTNHNTPMSKEQYNTMFKDMISLKSFMKEGKREILEKIYKDMKLVHEALLPLRQIGIHPTIDLTGGAVRDFVMNHHDKISDLDVMVSFSYISESKLRDAFKSTTAEKLGLPQEVFDDLADKSRFSGNKHLLYGKIIEAFVNKKSMVEKSYLHEDRYHKVPSLTKPDYDEMKTDRLAGVIKLKHPDFNYKIDLLLTDFVKPAFIRDFDVNLCKASLCFVNQFYKKDFPKDFSHLISRFSAEMEFFSDIVNKKLTIDIDNRSDKMINSILTVHVPKLLKKYPDYKINLVSCGYLGTERVKKIEKILWAHEMEDTLSKKEVSTKKTKL